MPECDKCGNHVPRSYERVKADRDGTVYCLDCDGARAFRSTPH